MARVLGVSAYYHDAAAALVVDGEVVCAIQEERLSRIKNDPGLPVRAIRWCLAEAGIAGDDLDTVVYYENPFAKLDRVLSHSLRVFPRALRQFPRAIGAQLGSKVWVLDQLAEVTGVPRGSIEYVSHHKSHAASAYFPSGFDAAAVLVADAVGEHATTSIWHGAGETLTQVAETPFPHSLGLFYAAMTAYLGFRVNEGEYKVMGLAAFGTPRFRQEFAQFASVQGDGSIELSLPHFAHFTDLERGFGPKLESVLGPARGPGVPWNLGDEETRRYADIAATTQAILEDAMLASAKHARTLTGASHLCMAGGVALNAVANARILREAGFDDVFVQPAAGDAGGALGAALLGALSAGDKRVSPMESAALGVKADPSRALEVATHMGFHAERLPDPAQWIATALSRDQVVALVSGRSEWGPRALGQRSILAAPERPDTRDRVNRVIKEREPFRPFAPAVCRARAAEYFAHSDNAMTPFMTVTCPAVAPDRLGAVVHVDGSSRAQTVTEKTPLLHQVLQTTPCVLNTSLNGRGEPICASVEDALAFFASHTVDALVVEDVLIKKRST